MQVPAFTHTVEAPAEPGTPTGRVATRIADRAVGTVVHVEGGRLVGLVSAGDLTKQFRRALDGLLAEGEPAEL